MEIFGHEICARCQCCEIYRMTCEMCGGEGMSGHCCGEDTCCCINPVENIVCDTCEGEGSWQVCRGRCDGSGQHPRREAK